MQGKAGELAVLSSLIRDEDVFRTFGPEVAKGLSPGPVSAIYMAVEAAFAKLNRLPTKLETDALLSAAAGRHRWSSLFQGEIKEDLGIIWDHVPTETTKNILTEYLRSNRFRDLRTEITKRTGEIELGRIKEILAGIENLGIDLDEDDENICSPFTEETLRDPCTLLNDLIGEPLYTGIPGLDERTLGFRNGELVVVVGSTGFGKTQLMTNLTQHFTVQRYNGIYFYMDNQKGEMLSRFWAIASGTDITEPQESTAFSRSIMAGVGGYADCLKMVRLEPGISTVADIKRYIKKIKAKWASEGNFNPLRYIIIDYADLLAPDRQFGGDSAKRHEQKSIFDSLNVLANDKLDPCVVFTPTQGNASSIDCEVMSLKHISEAFSKAWVAAHVLGGHATPEDLALGQFWLSVLKSRRKWNHYTIPMLRDINTMRMMQNPEALVQWITASAKKSK